MKPAGPPQAAAGVFDAGQAATLVTSDSAHWWFSSKARIVSDVVDAHLQGGRSGWLVDVGAGAGGVTAALRWERGRVLAIEGLASAASEGIRRHRIPFLAAHADHVPLRDRSAKVVTLLDVIEHLADPIPTLREAKRLLGDDGLLVVTVPAHTWLWSGADDFLGHQRRYNRPMLRTHLIRGGFDVIAMTHVFSWLVAPVFVQRRFAASTESKLGLGSDGPILAKAATWLASAERWVTSRTSLPLGTTVLAVARPATAP